MSEYASQTNKDLVGSINKPHVLIASHKNDEISSEVFNKAAIEKIIASRQEVEKQNVSAEDDVLSRIPVMAWLQEDGRTSVVPVAPNAFSTSVNVTAAKQAPMDILRYFGIRIDFKTRIDYFVDNYKKNYVMSKSHNFLMAKFSAIKMSVFGVLLSMAGVTADQMEDIRSKVKAETLEQNRKLIEENEYTGEMLAIMGGSSKKQMRAEVAVINEIRKQLIAQCENFGLKDYYTPRKILEIQTDECRMINDKLNEEGSTLAYQREMILLGAIPDASISDVDKKIFKVNRFISRGQHRIKGHESKMQKLSQDEKKLFRAAPDQGAVR